MTSGSLDEWLSQRSAKPCTAVRIRQEPLLTEKLIATVPWMSGLVSGLQNRVRRFESARNLKQQGIPEGVQKRGCQSRHSLFLFLYIIEFCNFAGTNK